MQSFNTKSIEYYLLQPANFRLDGGAMFGIIPKPIWNKVHPADELNRIDLALRLQLIKTNEKVILIDTGIGDYHGEIFDQRFDVRSDKSPLEKALAMLKISPEDVTDLVISHLHFDHIGGLIKINDGKKECVLPNAQIHLHQKHYEYSLNPSERDAGSFQSQYFFDIIEQFISQNKVTFYNDSEGELLKLEDGNKLKYRCSHGHTPWLMHPYDNKFIYLTDLIPTSNHVHIPWVMGYDISPAVTTKEKREFLQFTIDNNLTAIYEHDPKFWGSKVQKNDKNDFSALTNGFEYHNDIVMKIE